MKSLLRFLLFVLVIAMAVAILYYSRKSIPLPVPVPADSSLLTSLDREFTALVAKVLPSVVSIDVLPADAVNPRQKMLRRRGVSPAY